MAGVYPGLPFALPHPWGFPDPFAGMAALAGLHNVPFGHLDSDEDSNSSASSCSGNEEMDAEERKKWLEMPKSDWTKLPLQEVVDFVRKWQDDEEIALAVTQADPAMLRHLSFRLRDSRKVVLNALKTQSALEKAAKFIRHNVIIFASPRLHADRKVMLEALKAGGPTLVLASEELKQDKDFALEALRPTTLTEDPQAYDGNDTAHWQKKGKAVLPGEVVVDFVQLWPDDRDVVLAAVEVFAPSFRHASEALRADREVLLTALRHQTEEHVGGPVLAGSNCLSFAPDHLRADREVVLEATKAGGAAVELASLELRQDKDFILEAMRRAPFGDSKRCYDEADQSVRAAIGLDDFHAAFLCALAVEGELAPILTIALAPGSDDTDGDGDGDGDGNEVIQSCEATLLSGASFTCQVFASAKASARARAKAKAESTESATDSSDSSGGSRNKNAAPKATGPSNNSNTVKSSQRSAMIGRLAKVVVEELRARLQVSPAPTRVHLLLEKNGGSIRISPWDWNRRLNEFL